MGSVVGTEKLALYYRGVRPSKESDQTFHCHTLQCYTAAISLSLSCNDVGSVTMQLCITVGTEPFSALNGTYRTFSLHLPLMCAGKTSVINRLENIMLA